MTAPVPNGIPTLAQLQKLCPLGTIELDGIAQKEVRAVFAFRDLFTALVDPKRTEGLSEAFHGIHARLVEELYQGVDPDVIPQGSPAISAIKFHAATVEHFTARMLSFDNQVDARGLANYDTLDVLEKQAGEATHQRARAYSHRFGEVLAAMRNPAIPVPMIQCIIYAVVHALFRDIVLACLYRRNPEIRFPLHRLLVLNIDVPDEATALQAVVGGYQVPLIMALQPKEFPDVVDSSMFEKPKDEPL